MKFLMLSVLLFTSISNACPELNDVDLGNADDETKFELISEEPVKISRYKFKKIDAFKDFSYTRCKNNLDLKTLKSTETGRIFKAIVSNDHECDGDNTYGGLFDESGKILVGNIGDSFISCK